MLRCELPLIGSQMNTKPLPELCDLERLRQQSPHLADAVDRIIARFLEDK
jgi:hypothetical protein